MECALVYLPRMNNHLPVLGALLLLAACAPETLTHMPLFDWQGHRGARGARPENTLPAFRYALDRGVTTLELDLAVSADGHLVVSHEPWMNAAICLDPQGRRIPELEERRHNLYRMTLDTIQSYDCGSLRNPRFPEQQPERAYKPTFREVVEVSDDHARASERELPFYNIEIKSAPEMDGTFTPEVETFVTLVLAEVKKLDLADRTTVQSFDERVIVELNRQRTPTSIAYLTENPVDLAAKTEQFDFVPEIWSPYYPTVNAVSVAEARKLGMRVIPWTVNDPAVMMELKSIGVDGMITDYPDRIN